LHDIHQSAYLTLIAGRQNAQHLGSFSAYFHDGTLQICDKIFLTEHHFLIQEIALSGALNETPPPAPDQSSLARHD
jgi:hypothetical protein